MAYATTRDVAAFCRNLINGAEDFSTATVPTKADVENWLSSGCARIEQFILSQEYTPPPPESSALYAVLAEANALFAASRAEMARTNVRLAPGERTRGQVFMEMFKEEMKELSRQSLNESGMSYTSPGYVGGISAADKDTIRGDTDRISSRFERGDFRMPGTVTPGRTTTGQTRSSDEDDQ